MLTSKYKNSILICCNAKRIDRLAYRVYRPLIGNWIVTFYILIGSVYHLTAKHVYFFTKKTLLQIRFFL